MRRFFVFVLAFTLFGAGVALSKQGHAITAVFFGGLSAIAQMWAMDNGS